MGACSRLPDAMTSVLVAYRLPSASNDSRLSVSMATTGASRRSSMPRRSAMSAPFSDVFSRVR